MMSRHLLLQSVFLMKPLQQLYFTNTIHQPFKWTNPLCVTTYGFNYLMISTKLCFFFLPLTYKFFISIFSYTRVLVHYPYMVFLVVFVVITTCLVLSLTLVEFPKFGNPLDVSMITLILIFKLHIFLLSFINGITMSSINN